MQVYILNNKLGFPDPKLADESGLLAVGGDLCKERLLLAYQMGIFPWYSDEQPLLWFSPDPRLVVFPKEYKVNKTLLKTINTNKFDIKVDTNFIDVIKNCSKVKRKGQTGTWITNDMIEAYINLHEEGYAHSFEVYTQGNLVGGLYGLSLGGAFFGESMFYNATNASKVAFYYLVKFCLKHQFDFIDCQVSTGHMKSLGGVEISREKFLELLQNSLKKDTLNNKWTKYLNIIV